MNVHMKQVSPRIVLLTAVAAILNACGPRAATTDSTSSLFAIDQSIKGSELSLAEAPQKLSEFCGTSNDQAYALSIAGKVTFQAGYLRHFDGSGSSYRLNVADTVTGKKGAFRSSEAQSYSTNGMAMYPPSKQMDHLDYFATECQVVARALEGQNNYRVDAVTTGAEFGGTLTDGSFNLSDCFSVDLSSRNSKRTMAFCPTGFFQNAEVTGTASSKTQLVMQTN